MEKVEDVLLHHKLLSLEKVPDKCPVYHIRFLEGLSAPYLQSTPTVLLQEVEPFSHNLRTIGLCLVPILCMLELHGATMQIFGLLKTISPNLRSTSHPSADHKINAQQLLHTVAKKRIII
ncbi:uncharacterized protein LOC127149068 [Cucumis melo]|uniref:Uncharacterized protein LOC127149068 n=1 Tax=Cucumis melo TaxID=3656 RepID=A0ABM3KPT0_CUCME|nr:uncharacterized protein LOC127149068 [Cucumis melo]XP_050939799.1 uncharacterized protein LOC127149068 [Cucumis melo]